METRRRELLATAVATAAAVSTSVAANARERAPDASPQAQDQASAQALREIRDELRTLREELREPPGEVVRVRAVQNTYLRSTSKYPDVIEVGTRYWEVIHDWLRESPQPIEVMQLPTGRYGMRFGFTTLVLRPDAPADFLGTAQER